MLRLGPAIPLALATVVTTLAGVASAYADSGLPGTRHGTAVFASNQKARVLKVGTKNPASPSSWNTRTHVAPPAPARKAVPEFPKPGKAAAIAAGNVAHTAGTNKPAPDAAVKADVAPAPDAPDVWSPADIANAKAQCTDAMKRLNAAFTYQDPIKQGECGNPAPILVSRIGNVAFSPAARINCGMLVPLNTWITRNLQPAAARQFGARITQIEVMSDYSCRAALGRRGNRLSQHAYLDALDIRGFHTAKGQRIHVLKEWGPTQRDITKAEKKLEKLRQTQKQDEAALRLQNQQAMAHQAEASDQFRGDTAARRELARSVALRAGVSLGSSGQEMVTALLPGGSRQPQSAARLGGPEVEAVRAPSPAAPTASSSAKAAIDVSVEHPIPVPSDGPQARFLREAHASACKIFGTTLGPEANEAHRNHFHVDMAQRSKVKHICR